MLPDHQVPVEADGADFSAAAVDIVETGDAVADHVPESLLDARQAHVEIVTEGIEPVV